MSDPKQMADKDNNNRISAQALREMVKGLSRVIEGQRQFADELGLSYDRLFHDGYESFKGKSVEAVLWSWLSAESKDSERIEALFADLMHHEYALVRALESVHQENDAVNRTGLLQWLKDAGRKTQTGTHRRYMEVTAPAFIAAYARAREQQL